MTRSKKVTMVEDKGRTSDEQELVAEGEEENKKIPRKGAKEFFFSRP